MEKISGKSENKIDTNSGCPIKKLKSFFKKNQKKIILNQGILKAY